jgi:hypothetical protein
MCNSLMMEQVYIFISLAGNKHERLERPRMCNSKKDPGLIGICRWVMISCTSLFALFEVVVAILKADEDLLTLVSELGEASRSGCASEEAGRPFDISGLPISRFLTLTLLKLLFLCRGLGVLPAENGFGNTVPEFTRLVGQLLVGRRDNLLDREQRVDVDEENLVGVLRSRGGPSGEVDLVVPSTFDATYDGLFWNVLDPGCVVVVNVTLVDNTFNLILSLAQPSFLDVMKDDFDAGFLACYEASIGDADVKVA